MAAELRKSGIGPLGEIAWGTHVCHFYESDGDFVETIVPYLSAGLAGSELCMLLIADSVSETSAIRALRDVIPDYDHHVGRGALEVASASQWYRVDGVFDPHGLTAVWDRKIEDARRSGFAGIRVGGCEAWLAAGEWRLFQDYEEAFEAWVSGRKMIVLCSYGLAGIGAAGVLDVARSHQFVLTRRDGEWEVLERPELREARDEIRRLNEQLQQRVEERTRQQAAVARFGQTAIRERNLRSLMREVTALAAETLGTGRAIVWQLRPEHRDFVLCAQTGWDDLAPDATLPLEAGTASSYVIGTDSPVMIEDFDDARFSRSWLLREHHVATMITTVVRARQRPWGMLSVHSLTPRSFTTDDVEFLQSMANVLALVIERNDYEVAQAKALARVRAMQSITDDALGRMSLDDMLNELLSRLCQSLRADRALVGIIDGDGLGVSLRAAVPTELRNTRIPLLPIASRVLYATQPIVLNDLPPPDSDDWRPYTEQGMQPPRAVMGAPLIVQGKRIGGVVVSSLTPREFTDDELDLLRMVAERVAPAVERSRLIETIGASSERLEALSRRLLTVQEEERRRLAVELHDELGQIYTAIKIKLDSVQRRLRNPATRNELAEAIAIVDRATATVHDLALDLRPAMLDDLGLAAALRWYADRFARQTGVAIHLSLPELPAIDSGVATASFRVVQEALTNVARHANARNVWIDVRVGDSLELRVRDDGAGFDVPAARARAIGGASLGILGMEERVSLVSGRFQMTSTPGEGTIIAAQVPLGSHE